MIELNTIYNEDCLEGMKRIPDGSVDMVLCDLPYGTTQNKWDAVIPLNAMWEQYERVCRGPVVLTSAQPFTTILVASNLKSFKYSWVWEKSLKTNFLNAKKQPLRNHEDILVFCTEGYKYNPQGLTKGSVSGGNKITGSYGGWTPGQSGQQNTGYPCSVLKIANPNQGNIHPTQKPVALFEYLIRTYSNEGETVLDNAMGSGTTAIACLNAGRNFIGFEKDADYCQKSCERVARHSKAPDALTCPAVQAIQSGCSLPLF